MIEKLDTKMEYVEISILGNKKAECLDFEAGKKLNLKINELVDVVNTIQKEREAERFEIREWIGILEAVRKSVNIHEKQIDELQQQVKEIMTWRFETDDEPAENTNISKMEKDPYAEQRKWVGCLVEYKLGDLYLYGILTDIKDGYTLPFVIDETSYTDDCWLPDESVIYHKTKGGDNE